MKLVQKSFQIVLVTFLVIFTAAGAVLLVSALTSLLVPTEISGVFAVSGGASFRMIELFLFAFLLLIAIGIYLISRRSKLH
ncbi:MAG TPA: hypothetical protein VGQ39_01725 [Pyrinomonadaceae bacterium]|jgi:branched-subunit amino acid ABC-type transport system permease component|nr:hypothetical protein [Pyrinomonadaceae bacterium]